MLAQFERALPLVDEVAAAARAGERAGWERAIGVWSERAVEAQNAAHEYGLKMLPVRHPVAESEHGDFGK